LVILDSLWKPNRDPTSPARFTLRQGRKGASVVWNKKFKLNEAKGLNKKWLRWQRPARGCPGGTGPALHEVRVSGIGVKHPERPPHRGLQCFPAAAHGGFVKKRDVVPVFDSSARRKHALPRPAA